LKHRDPKINAGGSLRPHGPGDREAVVNDAGDVERGIHAEIAPATLSDFGVFCRMQY